ncbi:hypothetical protein PF005_g4328 [Phytophthora fragariae]|uniref:RxLR effector protein n=1 Tax=Phytophthora fragariae TaxID=53985 RepID=A0A6A3LX91_9STRA|nr:hypothetical protein PF003_g15868 [Phytophthora fragariae]KAE8946526.1 hypothetical protein PF009_g3849 [Phytophthora fragariae]KAE9023916.1 hypothetical protein PF011_g3756 [Phytophthora fragariae]KAE9129838.1 hypothetical protein PF010_g4052 [Phytophthora fragariae]KAE9129926.1 hypothetical protein PF007_g4703 [Phytophthora fragariae]
MIKCEPQANLFWIICLCSLRLLPVDGESASSMITLFTTPSELCHLAFDTSPKPPRAKTNSSSSSNHPINHSGRDPSTSPDCLDITSSYAFWMISS